MPAKLSSQIESTSGTMRRTETSRRDILCALAAAGATTALAPALAKPADSESLAELPSLKDEGKRSGIAFGLSEATWSFPASNGYYEQLCKECNIYAPGNDFNWAAVEKAKGIRVYGKLDALTNFMKQRGVGMIGHTLLWYHTIPAWVSQLPSNAEISSAADAYVSETVTRFRGSVVRWDVINEPIRLNDGPDGLRRMPLLDKLGPDYMKQAFAAAKAADPAVSLCCNEYGFEYKKADNAAKRTAFLNLLRRFRDDKVAIDCIGLQSHLDASQQLDLDGLSAFMREVKSLGYKVAITELDVIDEALDANEDVRDHLVANHVKDYLSCITAEVKPTTITCWGFTDGHTWLTMFHRRKDGRAMRPLPFDDQFNRKEQWAVIRQFLLKA
jgi:endo-1,4-beta-xylanase